jgi:hypothetical protein
MANTSISDFKSKLVGGGARANLFQVTVNFPSLAGGNNELASFLITAASLPASLIASITIPFRGRQMQVAGDRHFEPWNITVINDNSFSIRNAFEVWMNAINAHAANTGLTNPSAYSSDMQVDQLDKAGNVVQTYNMRSCFPTAISAIDLSNSNENTIEQFTVELQVLYWENAASTD